MPDRLIQTGLNILSIHTANRACDVCVLSGDKVSRKTETMAKGQDVALPLIVRGVVEESGLALNDIDRVAVVTGPGSFTGLRIGLAFSRALGLTLARPVLGVNSLEASAPYPSETPVRVALAAKRRPPDRSWWVDTITNGMSSIAGPAEMDADSLTDLQTREPMVLFTDEIDTLQATLPSVPVSFAAPSVVTAALIAHMCDPADRPPNAAYTREPDAALPQTKT